MLRRGSCNVSSQGICNVMFVNVEVIVMWPNYRPKRLTARVFSDKTKQNVEHQTNELLHTAFFKYVWKWIYPEHSQLGWPTHLKLMSGNSRRDLSALWLVGYNSCRRLNIEIKQPFSTGLSLPLVHNFNVISFIGILHFWWLIISMWIGKPDKLSCVRHFWRQH